MVLTDALLHLSPLFIIYIYIDAEKVGVLRVHNCFVRSAQPQHRKRRLTWSRRRRRSGRSLVLAFWNGSWARSGKANGGGTCLLKEKGKGEEQRGSKGDCSRICIKNNTAPPAKRVRACRKEAKGEKEEPIERSKRSS